MDEGRHPLTLHEVGTRLQALAQLHAHILDVFNDLWAQIIPPNVVAQPAQLALVACGQRRSVPALVPAAEVRPDCRW